jgi:L-ascorbate metabolism protein UlaG (beta-lactamase superfamily)
MDINWLGHSCFRIKGKKVALVTDPFDEGLGYPTKNVAADIVTVSRSHPGHNFVSKVSGQPKIIRGPGEYEIGGVFIIGISTFHDSQRGKQLGKNTVYLIEIDEVKICHLGDLGHVPSAEQVEEIDNADVLLVPVGGRTTINATLAAETVNLIEPKFVIPMHFKTEMVKKELDPLDNFLKEMGIKEIERQSKLTVAKSNLPSEMQVIVLDYYQPTI